MTDDGYKKSEHIKPQVWQEHLTWMEIVGKQVEDNSKQRQYQARGAGAGQAKPGRG